MTRTEADADQRSRRTVLEPSKANIMQSTPTRNMQADATLISIASLPAILSTI